MINKLQKIKKIPKIKKVKKVINTKATAVLTPLQELLQLISIIYPNKTLSSFDVETTGLSSYKGAIIFSYCIGSIQEYDAIDVQVYRVDNYSEPLNKKNRKILFDYWQDTSIIKVIHNYKFELSFLLQEKIPIPEGTIIIDTMVMHQCLRNLAPAHALDYIFWEFGGDPDGEFAAIDKEVKNQATIRGGYQKVDKKLMDKYQINDGTRPLAILAIMLKTIYKDKRRWEDYLIELRHIIPTQHLESFGILLDIDNINKLKAELTAKLLKVRYESFRELNEFVNLNSDKMICDILYNRRKYPILCRTKTKEPSTDKDVLLELRKRYPEDKIFDLILKQRSYTKALSTIESYLKFADNKNIIYPNIRGNGAPKTGRQSSSDPNLQNVSKEEALKNPFPVALRLCFKSRKNAIIALPDYSGIEMRLIASESGELELIEILRAGGDVHHATVECFLMVDKFNTYNDAIYNTGVEKATELLQGNKNVYSIHRSAYKNTGFCIAYGGGISKVAVVLGKSVDEIATGDFNYRRRFPQVDGFSKSLMEIAKQEGCIYTAFGRKLNVPRNKTFVASNYKIQGTAAGILKRGQIKVDKMLRKKYHDRIRMIIPIHDEVLFHIPKFYLPAIEEVMSDITFLLTDMPEIKVPLEVSWKFTSTDWAHTTKDIKSLIIK